MANTSDDTTKEKIAMLRGLRQVRQFTTQRVPDEVINDILEVARWTGSGSNEQPWEFILVRDHDTLREIAAEEGANSHLARADFGIIVLMAGKTPGIEN